MSEKNKNSHRTYFIQFLLIPIFLAFLAKPLEDIYLYFKNIEWTNYQQFLFSIFDKFSNEPISIKIGLIDAFSSLIFVFVGLFIRLIFLNKDSNYKFLRNFVKLIIVFMSFTLIMIRYNIISFAVFIIFIYSSDRIDLISVWFKGREMIFSLMILLGLFQVGKWWASFEQKRIEDLIKFFPPTKGDQDSR